MFDDDDDDDVTIRRRVPSEPDPVETEIMEMQPGMFIADTAVRAPRPETVVDPQPQTLSERRLPSVGNYTFGPYSLIGRTSGGDVEVWIAVQGHGGGQPTPCILKRVNPDCEAKGHFRALLKQEQRLIAPLDHPNIVHAIDAGEIDGLTYVVLELVDGVPLVQVPEIIGLDGWPASATAELAIHVADALAYAHAALGPSGKPLGMVHGSLRPHSIVVTRDGRAKVAELGVSYPTSADKAAAEALRASKLPYLAPEQFGMLPVDQRADVFALGAVMAELLTSNQLCPEGALAIGDVDGRAEALLRSAAHEVPTFLMRLILRMVAVDPDDRPETTGHVAAELRAWFGRQRGKITLAEFLTGTVFRDLPALDPTADPSPEQMEPIPLPDDCIEDIHYPTTVTLLLDDAVLEAETAMLEIPDPSEIQLVPIAELVIPPVTPIARIEPVPRTSGFDDSEMTVDGRGSVVPAKAALQTRRLNPEAVKGLLRYAPLVKALGLEGADRGATDPKRWEYFVVSGGTLGPRIVRKSLDSSRPYRDQQVVLLEGSQLLRSQQNQLDRASVAVGDNSIWARGESGSIEQADPSSSPSYLRYYERLNALRTAPRRGTSMRGKLLRFLGAR